MKFQSRPFCLAPWISMQYGALLGGPAGGSMPCCEWGLPAFEGKATEYRDSDYLQEIKKKMIAHDMDYLSISCRDCLDQENVGLRSKRLMYHERFGLETEIPDNMIYFDYRPGNTCNLKCRMCSPGNSSQIEKEQGLTLYMRDTTDFYDLDFRDAARIAVVGGEPSIEPKVHAFLDKLIDDGIASNITLQITTNATNMNPNWQRLLSGFGGVDAIISVDGTGPTYEYIRTNANWEHVRKNCMLYEEKCSNVNYHLTLSVLNAVSVEEWLPWFISLDSDSDAWPVERHEHLSLSVLPDDMRYEKIEYLNGIKHKMSDAITKLLSQTRFDQGLYERFIRWATHLDTLRGTDCSKVSKHHARLMSYANRI